MKTKTLLAIFVAVAALVGLSALACERGRESSEPGTAQEKKSSREYTQPDPVSMKAEAVEVTTAEVKPEEEARQFKWRTDYEATLKLAQETDRPVLVNFSGSDWCGWCIRLDKEVLSQKAFQDYAKENLVLFVADFPQRKEIPADVKKQNEALAEKYKIEGFPTVLLLNPKGEVLARTGYQPGGAEAYVKHVQDLLLKAEKGEKPSA